MLNRAAKRTTLAGAFVLTGLFCAVFTYRVMALKAAAAGESYREAAGPAFSLIDNAQFGTPQDLAKCRELISAHPL